MLTLCGFAASNYYNKVKIALLEKGVDFTEQLAWVGEVDRQASPLGKVPYMVTDQGSLCESAVMLEYIEQRYPQHPLLPSDPFAAAKVREQVTFLELHLELVARNLYAEALFGGKVSDEVKEKTKAQLDKNLRAFTKLVRFDPYLAGNTFGLADCAAMVHFPLISAATKVIYGQDLFADLPVRDYLKRMGERPYMAQVQADRKTNAELMMARIKAKSAAS